jgi:hypothetical protein
MVRFLTLCALGVSAVRFCSKVICSKTIIRPTTISAYLQQPVDFVMIRREAHDKRNTFGKTSESDDT